LEKHSAGGIPVGEPTLLDQRSRREQQKLKKPGGYANRGQNCLVYLDKRH